MPIIEEFEYYKPKSLDEALALKSKYGSKASVLAGGTDLINALKAEMVHPDVVIDIKALDDFCKIQEKAGSLILGANVTFTQIIESKMVADNFPILVEASETVASVGTRNRATMMGNICSAVPSADSSTPLLVLDAKIWVMSVDGEREIAIADWFTGPKTTALKDNEIALFIKINKPKTGYLAKYSKLGRYKGEDLAQANISLLKLCDGTYRAACGAVGPIACRVPQTEAVLSSKEPLERRIKKAVKTVESEISPIDDIRCSKEYRYHMIGVMLERGVKQLEGGQK